MEAICRMQVTSQHNLQNMPAQCTFHKGIPCSDLQRWAAIGSHLRSTPCISLTLHVN